MMRKMHMDERTGIFVFKGNFNCTVGRKKWSADRVHEKFRLSERMVTLLWISALL